MEGLIDSNRTSTDVPVDHLDYEYINKCSNEKELEKILKALRSGKEGKWPDLEKCCETRLRNIFPKSKLLRVSSQPTKTIWLDQDSRKELSDEFSEFLSDVGEKDKLLRENKNITPSPVTSIRNKTEVKTTTTKGQPPAKVNSERINSYDYRAWDRYDVDGECEKVDQQKDMSSTRRPRKKPEKVSVNSEMLRDVASKELAAEREKDKGNEAFRAGDYDESIQYYDNSIEISPSTATFNNRGLAKLKLERYHKALLDFNHVLGQEPENIKALLRRSSALEKIGSIRAALSDLEKSVAIDPSNARSSQLLKEFNARHEKLLAKGGKRVQIVESSEDEEDNIVPNDDSSSLTNQSSTDSNVTSSENASSEPVCVNKETEADLTLKKPDERQTDVNEEPKNCPKEKNTPDETIIVVPDLDDRILAVKQKAGQFFSNGQYSDAAENYTTCLGMIDKSKPGVDYHTSVLLSNRAACHLKIGDLTSCIKDCNQSLDLNPKFVKSILRRGLAYEGLENITKAYEDFRLTVVMDPTQTTAHQGVTRAGNVLKARHGKDWRNYVSAYSTLPSGPTFVETKKSQPQKSAPCKQPVVAPPLKTEPASPQKEPTLTKEQKYALHKDKGNEFVRQCKYEDALKCYETCITIDNDMIPAHLNSALCYLKTKQYEKAESSASKVLQSDPKNIKALFRRASANKELHNYRAAIIDLKDLLGCDPKNAPANQLMETAKKLWGDQLRSMKTVDTKPKGKKIQIVADSDSDEEQAPTTVKAPPKPQPAAPPKETTTVKPKSSKPWLKKTTGSTTSTQGTCEPTPFTFLQSWSSYQKKKDINEFGKVLEFCNAKSFDTILGSSITTDMIMAIFEAVAKYFIPKGLSQHGADLLLALTKAQRFDVLAMMMSREDKSRVKDVTGQLVGVNMDDKQRILECFS